MKDVIAIEMGISPESIRFENWPPPESLQEYNDNTRLSLLQLPVINQVTLEENSISRNFT